MRTQQYFIDKLEMQKHIKNALSTIDFKDYGGCIESIIETVKIANKYNTGASGYNFTPYQAKPNVSMANLTNDMNQTRKFGRNAISEVDFNNMTGLLQWLAGMH